MVARIDVDLRQLNDAIKRAEKAGINLKPAWRKLRRPMKADQAYHMKRQQGPNRASWPPLAASTIAKRLQSMTASGKAFTKRGKMKKSAQRRLGRVLSRKLLSGMKVTIKPKEMSVAARLKWAGVHQHGGRVGHGARIPPRPFIYIGDELLLSAKRVFETHLQRAWQGRRL